MSPRHFAKMNPNYRRQSEQTTELEMKVEQAWQFAFSPSVFHPIKTVGRLRRFLGRGTQSKP